MALQVLTKEDLQVFKNELLEDLKNLFQIRTTEQKLWLRSVEVKELLKISARTRQYLRICGNLMVERFKK